MENVKISMKAGGEVSADIIIYGNMERTERGLVVNFVEKDEQDREIATRVLYHDGNLVISRNGEMRMLMNFREGEINEMPIQTEHGTIDSRLKTKSLKVSEGEREIIFSLSYDLLYGGETTEHTMLIKVERMGEENV